MINIICLLIFFSEFWFSRAGHLSNYTIHLKQKFEHKFKHSCSKYSFVQRYLNISWNNEIDDFVVFAFEDQGKQGGGLGDRLGGMLTALAFAIRTNRKFIIQAGASPLPFLFRPYSLAEKEVNWASWDWLGWKENYPNNMTTLSCVNPNRRAQFCALDSIDQSGTYKVIRYTGNRCYICRWLKLATDQNMKDHLRNKLDIDWETNLYEVAGCLLRLVLYPTDLLWGKVDRFLHEINISPHNLTNSQHYQIGVHFRCGDSSFDESSKHLPNPECYWSPDIPWHGTNFGDDQTMDSPIDLAKCVNQSIHSLNKLHHDRTSLIHSKPNLSQRQNSSNILSVNRNASNIEAIHLSANSKYFDDKNVAIFVASDNIHSAKQISSNIGSKTILLPKESCHIDVKSHDQTTCAENTLVQWFALSLSDFLITQEMLIQVDTVYSDPVTDQNELKSRSPAPISAFSRYAITYGLSSHQLRYGKCSLIDPVSLSHYTHGNWLCVPKMFY